MKSTSRAPCITPCRRKQLVIKTAFLSITSWARDVNSRDIGVSQDRDGIPADCDYSYSHRAQTSHATTTTTTNTKRCRSIGNTHNLYKFERHLHKNSKQTQLWL